MENKHEQLCVAVQDLLIELGITPKTLKLIITDKSCIADCAASRVTAKTAQKLIDAGLIVEEINWKKPNKEDSYQKDDSSMIAKDKDLSRQLKVFIDKINTSLSDEAMFDKIKISLAPGILWSYLREEHPGFLYEQIKDYLFPSG